MKIVIAGNYGAKNLGDEMILEGMIKTIKSIDQSIEITVLSANPAETERNHNIKAVHKVPAGIRSFIKYLFKRDQKTKKTIKECDYFILGGGGLFSNLTLRAYFIWGIQAFTAVLYKKPIIMYGQSIGPLKTFIQRKIVKKLFNKAIFIAVRDASSIEELKKIGIKKEIHLIPDMIFALNTENTTEKKKKIIVAIRHLPSLEQTFKNELINFINWLIENKNYEIEMVNFQHPNDEILCKEISDKINQKNKLSISPQIHFAKDLFKLFSEASYVVGMRLHSVLSAIKTETPFIAINYAPKVGNFLRCAKLGDFIVEMKNPGLKKRFKKTEISDKEIKTRLQAFNKHAKNRHKIMTEELKKILYTR